MSRDTEPLVDAWSGWRLARLESMSPSAPPAIPDQDAEGGFVADSGRPSPGATGEALCHLVVLGLAGSGAVAIAADWLEEVRTPALAWLDSPDDVPGVLEEAATARVWATAAAACGLLAVGRDPGRRALALLRGEACSDGRFTGGAYPTAAAAGAYWLAEGPKNELSEWALKWARESSDELGPWEKATALTFWAAAGIPGEHLSVEQFLDDLRAGGRSEADDGSSELFLRIAEVINWYEAA